MSQPEDMVCYCAGVTRATIVEAITDGATTLADIQEKTGAGIGERCKELNPKGACCHSDIRAILMEESAQPVAPQARTSCCDDPGCNC